MCIYTYVSMCIYLNTYTYTYTHTQIEKKEGQATVHGSRHHGVQAGSGLCIKKAVQPLEPAIYRKKY